MADLRDIEISIEVDVLQAQKAFRDLERDTNRLKKAVKDETISEKQNTVASEALRKRKEALTEAVRRGGKEFRQYNNRLNQAKSGSNKFGMVSQQVGYQVGDFFVQVQSGTSALVAFGQQGTQLAGLLPGVAGAVIGVGLAVGTMLLRSFMQAKGEVKNLEEALKNTTEATDLFEKSIKGISDLNFPNEINKIDSSLRSLHETMKQIAEINIFLGMEQAMEKMNITAGFFEVMLDRFLRPTGSGKRATRQKDLEDLGFNKGVTLDLYDKYNKDINKAISEKNTDLIIKLSADFTKLATSEGHTITKLGKDYITNLQKLAVEASRYKQILVADENRFNKKLGEQYKFLGRTQSKFYELQRKNEIENQKVSQRYRQKSMGFTMRSLSTDESKTISDRYRLKAMGTEVRPQDPTSSFDVIMAQELVDQENYKQSRIKFARDMEILAQQLAVKGGMQQMAKIMLPKEERERFEVLREASLERQKMLKLELKYEADSKELFDAKTQIQKEQLKLSLKEHNINWTLRGLLAEQFVEERNIEWAIRQQVDAVEKVKNAEEDLADKRKQFADQMGGYLESGFMSMIDGTKSVAEAFRSMAADILKHLYKVLVVQTAIRNIGGAIGGTFGAALSTYGLNANGNAFNNGKIIPYANGGVVGSPTMFPMSGGNTGLMGEAGPEAILPLKRGPNGKLGVESSGGSVVVNQTINVSTGVAQTVRNEIKTLMPQIAEGAKSAVLDAKRRGGSFGSAFA